MSDFCNYCNYHSSGAEYLCDPRNPDICAPCQKLSEIEDKIEQIREMLVGLAKVRQKLKEEVNQIHDRIVHHLPLEVASTIFEMSLPENVMDLDLSRASRYSISAPIILSTVCRRWRTIAYATPRLWNTLLLCDRDSQACTLPTPAFVEDCIARAGNFPLSVNMYVIYESNQTDAIIEIIAILRQCANRWLEFRYEGPSYLISHLPNKAKDLILLRRLHLKVSHGQTTYQSRTTFDLGPRRLDALSITQITLIADKFDWKHLSELELGYALRDDCFKTLIEASNLTRCILSADPAEYIERDLPQRVPVLQNSIQYLKITGSTLYQDVLSYLSCPALTTLVLDSGSNPCGLPAIVAFLNHSGCALEALELVNAELSDSDVGLMCSAIPTLKNLKLDLFNSVSFPAAKGLVMRLGKFTNGAGGQGKVPRYLPDLSSLTVIEDIQTDWKHWRLLPDIFEPRSHSQSRSRSPNGTHSSKGSSASLASNKQQRQRQALGSVSVCVHRCGTMTKANVYAAVGKRALERILGLGEAEEGGVQWSLTLGEEEEDVLGPALEWFRLLEAGSDEVKGQ